MSLSMSIQLDHVQSRPGAAMKGAVGLPVSVPVPASVIGWKVVPPLVEYSNAADSGLPLGLIVSMTIEKSLNTVAPAIGIEMLHVGALSTLTTTVHVELTPVIASVAWIATITLVAEPGMSASESHSQVSLPAMTPSDGFMVTEPPPASVAGWKVVPPSME